MNKRMLGFSIFMGAMFCLTSGLGMWQVQRLSWKEQLIARFEEAQKQPPLAVHSINNLLSVPEELRDGARVEFEATIDSSREIHSYAIFYPSHDPKQPLAGYWVISPATLKDGTQVILSRGMVPNELKGKTAEFAAPSTPQKFTGVMRKTETGNFATPTPDLAKNVWFARDVEAMSAHFKLPKAYPFYLQITESPKNAWPQAQQLKVQIPNNHLGYALTWFGLAFVIAVGYMVVVRKSNGSSGQARG